MVVKAITDRTLLHITQQGMYADAFYAFGFFRDENGIYHTRQDALQLKAGYNNIYDTVFDIGTHMKKDNFPFKTDDGQEYILWIWKGDYLNLGAGAELGIYKRADTKFEHWVVDRSLEMPMELSLRYYNNRLFYYNPNETQWWITGFDPMCQNVKVDHLTAIYTVDFSNQRKLYDGFKNRSEGKNAALYFLENYKVRFIF